MVPYALIIALGAGLISAVVFVSATTGPLLIRFLLFFLTPLALFLAGLGWRWTAALAAGLFGTAFVLLAGNPVAAFVFASSQALPAALLSYLVSLHRQVAQDIEWYPVGRIVIAAALVSGFVAGLWLLLLGGDIESLRKGLRSVIDSVVQNDLPQGAGGAAFGEAEIAAATDLAMNLFPAAAAVSSMGSLLFSLWLAGRIMQAAGQLPRPWPDLAAATYPPRTPLLLAIAAAATFLAGAPRLLASGFAGALLFAYVLVGLAIVHSVTRGRPWRPFALWFLYLTLVINAGVSLLLALLGLAETIFPMRRPRPPRAGGPPN